MLTCYVVCTKIVGVSLGEFKVDYKLTQEIVDDINSVVDNEFVFNPRIRDAEPKEHCKTGYAYVCDGDLKMNATYRKAHFMVEISLMDWSVEKLKEHIVKFLEQQEVRLVERLEITRSAVEKLKCTH